MNMLNQALEKIVWIVPVGRGIALCTVVSGCAVTVETSLPAPEPPAPVVDVQYQELVPDHAPRTALAEGESVMPPVLDPKKVVAPEFPQALLLGDDLAVQILARLVIDAEGRVTHVLFDDAAQNDALKPFRESIRMAARQWVFLPMIIVKAPKLTPEGRVRRQNVPTPVSLWYRFEFTLQNGQPETSLQEQPMI